MSAVDWSVSSKSGVSRSGAASHAALLLTTFTSVGPTADLINFLIVENLTSTRSARLQRVSGAMPELVDADQHIATWGVGVEPGPPLYRNILEGKSYFLAMLTLQKDCLSRCEGPLGRGTRGTPTSPYAFLTMARSYKPRFAGVNDAYGQKKGGAMNSGGVGGPGGAISTSMPKSGRGQSS